MIHVGTIGFAYEDWAGAFFPRGLAVGKRLEYYATQFSAIELDTTFYALPPMGVVERWRDAVPSDFRFALKAPRELTHGEAPGSLLSLASLRTWADFTAVLDTLGAERCVALLQFPPGFAVARLAELERFLDQTQCPCRMAIEFRHASWWREEVVQALRGRGVAWVWADLVPLHEANLHWSASPTGYAPFPPYDTTSWRYLRLCGRHGQYESDAHELLDPTPRLRAWMEVMASGHPGPLPASHMPAETRLPEETLVFCGNSYAGFGIATADRFAALASLPPREELQPSLF